MEIKTYHINAFANQLFSGNPACVCILPHRLSEQLMQKMAAEHYLPATAFLWKENQKYYIRWFAPEYEIDLCGHGTLASAYIIFHFLQPHLEKVDLCHKTEILSVQRNGDYITLNFPIKPLNQVKTIPDWLSQGLGVLPEELYEYHHERLLAVIDTEEKFLNLKPNKDYLKKMKHRGLIVTAKSQTVDFVSRVFYPQKNIFEDAATGSSYCLLLPYWSSKLNQSRFLARQLSKRQGEVVCEIKDDRAYISGQAVLYMQGTMTLDGDVR